MNSVSSSWIFSFFKIISWIESSLFWISDSSFLISSCVAGFQPSNLGSLLGMFSEKKESKVLPFFFKIFSRSINALCWLPALVATAKIYSADFKSIFLTNSILGQEQWPVGMEKYKIQRYLHMFLDISV